MIRSADESAPGANSEDFTGSGIGHDPTVGRVGRRLFRSGAIGLLLLVAAGFLIQPGIVNGLIATHGPESFRYGALKRLSRSPRFGPPIFLSLMTDPDPDIRLHALMYLVNQRKPLKQLKSDDPRLPALRTVIAEILDMEDLSWRSMAVDASGQIAGRSDDEIRRRLARHTIKAMRGTTSVDGCEAATALAQDAEAGLPVFFEELAREPPAFIRNVRSMQPFGKPPLFAAIQPRIADLMRSDEPTLRALGYALAASWIITASDSRAVKAGVPVVPKAVIAAVKGALKADLSGAEPTLRRQAHSMVMVLSRAGELTKAEVDALQESPLKSRTR